MPESRIQDLGIAELRARCEQASGLLAEIVDVHLEIDTPTRLMDEREPDWIGRLRKVLLHVMAINRWEIGVDVEHVIAPDARAACEQISAVLKCLPPSDRLDGVGSDPWSKEAGSKGMLATYTHPTPQVLLSPAGFGGFSVDENWLAYAQIVMWLGLLGFGYALAVSALAKTLNEGVDVESRVDSVIHRATELFSLNEMKVIAETLEKEHAEQS